MERQATKHLIMLRAYWILCQQTACNAIAQDLVHCKFMHAMHPLPPSPVNTADDHLTDAEAGDELPIGAEAQNIDNANVSEAECPQRGGPKPYREQIWRREARAWEIIWVHRY